MHPRWLRSVLAGGAVIAAGAEPARNATAPATDPFAAPCEAMVRTQIEARGSQDAAVIAAMRRVPRHEFVPAAQRPFAHEDRPLPTAAEQTISQPLIVARMTERFQVKPGQRRLETGPGSGDQAAVLAGLQLDGYSLEIIEGPAKLARATLARLGYENRYGRGGDDDLGRPAAAPFDAIIVTAAPGFGPGALRLRNPASSSGASCAARSDTPGGRPCSCRCSGPRSRGSGCRRSSH